MIRYFDLMKRNLAPKKELFYNPFGQIEGDEDEPRPRSRSVLSGAPLVEIVAYMLSNGIGVGTVPWLLLGELCPAKVKGVASGKN